MRYSWFAAAALWGLTLLVGCSGITQYAPPAAIVAAAPPAPPPIPAWRGPIVQLNGTSEQLGEEQGRQLAGAIKLLHDKYLTPYLGSGARRFLALGAAQLFESYFRPEHLAETLALARETGTDPRETVLAQCFLDLSPMEACSTITLPASAAPDHIARFGRNLEFPSLGVADKYSTVFVYHPQGRYAFVSIGWPGMIGVLSGMNQFGLSLANMEVARRPRFPSAMPYTLLYRTVLEHCRTVDEAIDLLRKTPRQTANNLMLMDASGDRAVVEITPKAIFVRRGQPTAPLISTNHQRGQDCDTPGRGWRYDMLHQMGQTRFGTISLPALEAMLADVSPGDATMQSMVFEPANRVIYLSTGANAARGMFYKLDLERYFKSTTAETGSMTTVNDDRRMTN